MTSPQATTALVKEGEQAPAFDLPAFLGTQPAGNIKLSDYHGKKHVILAFYPKDDTPGCTKEMCAFSEDLSKFDAVNAQPLGISCDNVDSHGKFVAKFNLKQPLLADVGGVVGKAYGTVVEGKQTANRVTFVIDKNGIVQKVIEGMPSNADLLEVIKTLG
jgi:peroxiredoxin Q/BCP